MALVMQGLPCAQLLDHPNLAAGSDEDLTMPVDIPLAEALMACDDLDNGSDPPQKKRKLPEDNMKIHAYVNRIVKCAAEAQEKAKPTASLTSHSFRRGGAQHANSDPLLSAQWIFDRGSWNMTATNKAFAYVFSTTSEDQKVSRVLSGWDSSQKPAVPTLSWFDSSRRQQALKLGNLLFQSSVCAQDPTKRLNARNAEVLTASLIQHFPEILNRYPICLYATRMRQYRMTAGVTKSQVFAWSSELQSKATKQELEAAEETEENFSRKIKLINHQNCIIGELMAMNRALTDRVNLLQNQLNPPQDDSQNALGASEQAAAAPIVQDDVGNNHKSCGSKAHPMSPAAIWFAWHAKMPRMWDVCTDRQKKSAYKQIVNYMKLFLQNGLSWISRRQDTAMKFFITELRQNLSSSNFWTVTALNAGTDPLCSSSSASSIVTGS
ncbi:hypothetical protein P3T76_007698 [Phytophthora citrophthora]|uniref:Uncharacterized protein n=1 Tax=Phytophthora citrophthora TaxID=4793 RepID=A0AAD9GM64_9STRA|nr:hypothetical protein P3T76_007698 [Phytophthora citrophthora]